MSIEKVIVAAIEPLADAVVALEKRLDALTSANDSAIRAQALDGIKNIISSIDPRFAVLGDPKDGSAASAYHCVKSVEVLTEKILNEIDTAIGKAERISDPIILAEVRGKCRRLRSSAVVALWHNRIKIYELWAGMVPDGMGKRQFERELLDARAGLKIAVATHRDEKRL